MAAQAGYVEPEQDDSIRREPFAAVTKLVGTTLNTVAARFTLRINFAIKKFQKKYKKPVQVAALAATTTAVATTAINQDNCELIIVDEQIIQDCGDGNPIVITPKKTFPSA